MNSAGWQAEFAAALLDPARPSPSGWHATNGSDPTRRLAVHRNNVVSSLVDGLAASFPVTQELTGTEFFRALAAVFVRVHPPRSPILAHYGADLPSFIEDFTPASKLPYLPDLARLEFTRLTACHAADAKPLDDTALARALIAPTTLAELRFAWHPSLRVFSSPYAVVTLWGAHQQDRESEAVELNHAEHAIVLRDALEVLVLPVDAGAACFAHLTQAGAPFGEAVDRTQAAHAPFDLVATLARLAHHGALTAIHHPDYPEHLQETLL